MVTIMQMTDVLIVSLDPYNTLMGDPKLEDEAWTDSVRQELIKWKTTYQQAQHMSVPSERFKAIHQKYLAALAQFDAAADDTAFGIVVGDPESLVEANDRLRSAAVLMKEIGAMIRTMKG